MSQSSAAALDRRLGPFDAAALVVSNVIGGGIFFVPILVAQAVPNHAAILLVWLAGGALAFAGAMAYAELAALRPRAGGEYVYLREAYGPLAGFLSGWTSLVAGFSGAIAAIAVALPDFIGRFIPGAGDATPLLTIPLPWIPLVISQKSLVGITVILLLTFVHLRGLGPGRVVQNLLAAGKVAALIVFIVLGFTLGSGGSTTSVTAAASGGIDVGKLLLALIPVMFTYSGWNAAAYVAEEIRSPERNLPLALGLGTAAVVAIYLGLNALYLHALPAPELAAVQGTLIDTVADRLFGFVAGNLIAAFTIVSMLASISAMILAGPRVYFAMARDGLFLDAATRIHPRFKAPTAAILAQTLWSAVLVLSANLSQLVSYTGFAIVLFSGAAVASVFVLRSRRPGEPRAFRAWGYPWAPALFVVVSAAMLVNDIARNKDTALAGLAVIALGIPVYYLLRHRR